VFKIHDKLYIGLSGLATDAQTLWVSRNSRILL
jgi:20S proteasome alpha/beta subunit